MPEAKGGPFVFWNDLAGGCQKAAALGFDAVEIFGPSAKAINCSVLEGLLEQHRLKLAALGTGAGWLLQKWHLCHPKKEIRESAREFIREMIDFGSKFNAPAIIGSMQGRIESPVTRNEALDWLGAALDDLGEHASRRQQKLLFEPLNRYETNLFNCVAETKDFLKKVGGGNVKILADLFHMAIEESSIPEAFRAAGDTIGHVHFADSNRRAIGFGHTEATPIMMALRDIGYTGYLSAEIFPWPNPEAAAEQTIKAYKHLCSTIS